MSSFKKEIETILKDGIKEYGTRYHTQKKLVWHYWSLGYSKEKCYESICEWYHSYNHQSKDWQKSPNRVLRNVKSAIESLYRNAPPKGHQPHSKHKKYLTVVDVRNIVQMTTDYRKQKFIFSLLEYALNAKDSKGQFNLPRVVITTFDCCSDKSYQEKIRFCESISLIRKVREYYRQERRARTYAMNFAFGKDGIPVNSLEQGLKRIFDLETLQLSYSKWVYNKILREG